MNRITSNVVIGSAVHVWAQSANRVLVLRTNLGDPVMGLIRVPPPTERKKTHSFGVNECLAIVPLRACAGRVKLKKSMTLYEKVILKVYECKLRT